MRLTDIGQTKGRFALVGMNSQGKTYALEEFYKKHKRNTIFLENETKADEALKNTAASSPLIDWLERLLDLKQIQNNIDEQICSVNENSLGNKVNLNIKLVNSVSSFKGLVSTKIETNSNGWNIPGSGETFLGELILVEQMIRNGKKNPIKYLIIDEPESYLHLSLYFSMCAILKRLSETMCVIISTHSIDFLKVYCDNLDQIIYVKNGELTHLKNNSEYIKDIQSLKLYTEYKGNMSMEVSRIFDGLDQYFRYFICPKILECLFCKTVVLGEGFAESAMFDCFMHYYAEEGLLGKTYFTTVSGKYLMPIYLFILSEIGVETVALFDKDSNKKDNDWNTAVNKEIEKLSCQHYGFEIDIEDELKIKNNGRKDRNYKTVTSPMNIQLLFLEKNQQLMCLLSNLKTLIDLVSTD